MQNTVIRSCCQATLSVSLECDGDEVWKTQNIGGFHVTQVSLIITQVKNKIKKLIYRRRVINKRAKVSGRCDILNLSYLAKGIA